ncbi:MAG: Hsp20/alpha crystallin family protein [Gemmatimonadota bacterium]
MLTLPTRRATMTPWRQFDGFENRVRRLLEESLGEAEPFGWIPAVNVVETDEEMKLTAELPGVSPEEVDIEIEGNVLSIRGEKKVEHEETDEGTFRLYERAYGAFTRSFTLPATVNAEKIAAEFENGVLMVHLPKTAEARGRRIQVEARKK